jgi:hypothetical protein
MFNLLEEQPLVVGHATIKVNEMSDFMLARHCIGVRGIHLKLLRFLLKN